MRIKKGFGMLLLLLMLLAVLSVSVYAASATKLNKKTATVSVGKTVKLKVKGIQKSVAVKWSSANKKIASVSSHGLVKGESAGSTTISAEAGGKKLTCKVVVKGGLVPMTQLDRYQYFRGYMTTAEMKKAYKEASKIVKPLLGKSKEEQVIGIALGLRAVYKSGITYSMQEKHYNDPYGYFVKKYASCAGCARATGFCLNMLGYKYEHVNENQYSHQWVRVKVGNKYWICDAYGLYVGPELKKRKHPGLGLSWEVFGDLAF